MGMRDVVEEARLQHAQSARDADRAVGIGQLDRPHAALAPPAEPPGQERGGERRGKRGERAVAFVEEGGVLGFGSDAVRGRMAREPDRVLRRLQRPLAALVIAEQRERRQEHGDRQKQLMRAGIKRLQPQPEMDAETAVNPDDQQQDRLQRAGNRRADPEFEQFLRIALFEAELAQRHAGADHMLGQQERDGEAEDELGRLQPRPPEMAPFVERPEAEAHMGQERYIEKRRARRRLPNELLDRKAALHRRDRNVAERVIGEVQRHIGIEDKTSREPDLTKAWHAGPWPIGGEWVSSER